MAVRDWLGGFIERHKARFSPHDWPAAEAGEEMREYMVLWLTAFATQEVGEQEADTASRRLATSPPNYRREHIPMVIDAVKQLRAERDPGRTVGNSRDEARYASRSCPHCGGEGLATVYHPWPDDANRIAPTASAYCSCSHGRFIKRNHAENNPEYLRRIPDLDVVLNGASVYRAEDPRLVERMADMRKHVPQSEAVY